MAGEKDVKKPEQIANGPMPDSSIKLSEKDRGKDGIQSDSVSSVSGVKVVIEQPSPSEQGVYYPPTSYDYYYPGYNGTFTQSDGKGYLNTTGGPYTLSCKQLRNQRPESRERPAKLTKAEGEDFSDCGEGEGEEKGALIGEVMNPNPRIQRYLLAIEYIGTRFSGAQQQSSCRTVVGVLEKAFQNFIGQPVSIFCSSRTDAGVHALSNVCHVDVERISKHKPGEVLPPHEPSVVKRAVSHFLQKNEGDIMVTDVQCVPADFHSRYKAQERTYFYRLLSGKEPLSTFEKDRAWHVPEELDLLAMQQACQVLVGRHDFSSFRAAACQAKSPIRTLDELTVTEVASSPYFPTRVERELSNYTLEGSSLGSKTDPHLSDTSNQPKIKNFGGEVNQGFGSRKKHRCFVVTSRARSFLYHQVRLLVGVLKSVGTGHLTIADVERILKAKSITAASPMAPACGLYLGHVKYDLPSDT